MKSTVSPHRWTSFVARLCLAIGALFLALPGIAQTITNPSFEADAVPAFPGYTFITGWTTLSANSGGINGAGGPFHDNGIIPDGEKVAFIQANESMTQLVSGFTVGSTYYVRFFENARNCCGGLAQLRVTIGGVEVVPVHDVPPVGAGIPYREVNSRPFLATAADLELAFFKSTAAGDNTALLDNVSIIEIPAGTAPTITGQPQGGTFATGDTVTLSVGASGSLPLGYQWKHGDMALTDETNATLVISDITTGHAGSYTVTVTNSAGTATSDAAVVTVLTRIPGLYNTGVDDDGNALPDGASDTHYVYISNPDSPNRMPVVHDSTIFPIVAGPWVPNNGGSKWISPRVNTVGSMGANYIYRITVDLRGFDLSSVNITGGWATDNDGVGILVNGQATGLTNPTQFPSLTPFSINSGNATLIPGINTIDFIVNNSALGYTGLKVDNFRAVGNPVADTAGPVLVSADSPGNPNGIVLTFSEPVSASALVADSYGVNNGVTVTAAAYGDTENVILLTTSALTLGTAYTVTVNDVQDQADPANSITFDSMASFVFAVPGGVTTNFESGLPNDSAVFVNARVDEGILKLTDAVNSQGGVFYMNNLNGGAPVGAFDLSFKARIGDGTCCDPSRFADGMSVSLANNLPTAPTSNNPGEEGLGSGLIVSFDTWDNATTDTAPAIEVKWNGVALAFQSLDGVRDAGRPPAGPLLMQDGIPVSIFTGSEFANVRIKVDADGTLDLWYKDIQIFSDLATPYTPISNARLAFGARTGGANAFHWIDDLSFNLVANLGPIVITTGLPAETTVDEGAPLVLSVAVDGSPVYSFQWTVDGSPITLYPISAIGQTGPTLSIPRASMDLNTVTVAVTVNNEFSSASSSTYVTVRPDLAKPTVTSVDATADLTKIVVAFSEPVGDGTAGDEFNYTIDHDVTVMAADLLPDQRSVLLTTSPLEAGTLYSVTIQGIADSSVAANVMDTVTETVTGWFTTNGVVLREIFMGNVGGNNFQTLSNNTRFPNMPNIVDFIPQAGQPQELRSPQTGPNASGINNYGARLRGWLVPTETGNYQFQMEADDSAWLILSTDFRPENSRTIFKGEGICCAVRTVADPVFLVAGVPYYIEVLSQEGGGGDYVVARWAPPSTPGVFTGIPPANLVYGVDPEQDTTAPALVSVTGSGSRTQLTILFNEMVDAGTALDEFVYSAVDQSGNSLVLSSPVLTADRRGVIFVTSQQAEGAVYSVTIDGLRDFAGNTLPITSQDFRSYVVTPGFVKFEYWIDVEGTVVTDLTGQLLYPNSPNIVTYSHIPWWPQPVNPLNNSSDGTQVNQRYGLRMSGYFIPQVDGDHRFYVVNDDQGQFRISPNENPADAVAIVTSACCRNLAFEEARSGVAAGLVAGNRYYFEALVKEGTGGDYLGIGVREPNDTRTLAQLPLLQSYLVAVAVDPAQAGQIVVATQPQNIAVPVGQTATFEAHFAATGDAQPFIQWQKDGLDIPGANSPIYTTPPVDFADEGAAYRAIGSIPGASATTTDGGLTVRAADLIRPAVASAAGRGTKINLSFTEALDNANNAVTDVLGYEVNGVVGVESVTLLPDNKSVILTILGDITGPFTVRVNTGIADAAGNTVAEGEAGSGLSAPVSGILALASVDIGDPLPAGSVFTTDNREFTVTAGGADVWSGGDQFTYAYETRTGNFDVKVRVDRLDFIGNAWSKAGLNIRETLDGSSGAASRMVWVYPTPTNGAGTFEAGLRAGPGENIIDIQGARAGVGRFPAWVRVKRVGKTFNAYTSYDGRNWDLFGVPQIGDRVNSFPDTLMVGIGVVSHVQGTPTTAELAEYGDWAFPNASIQVTQHPLDATNAVNTTRAFSVAGVVTGAPQHEISFQWQRNSIDIPGANLGSYTTPPLTLDDDGAQYSCLLLVSGASTFSSYFATLDVTPVAESTPPAIRTAYRSTVNPNQIIVNFSELLLPSTAINTAHYSLVGGQVVSAEVTRTNQVILTTTGIADCDTVTLMVDGVADASGNALAGAQVTIGQAGSRILLVVGNAFTMGGNETAILNRMLANGHEVVPVSAVIVERRGSDALLPGINLVFIHPSAGEGQILTRFRDTAVGVVVSRRELFDDMDFVPASANFGSAGNQTQINIVNAAHPLAGGAAGGTRTIFTTAREINFATGLPASAIIVAQELAGTARAVYFGFEKGAELLNARTAQGRRVGFFARNNLNNLNADGLRLVDGAVNWTLTPQILAGPQDQTVPAGGTATFCVLASSGSPATYQWFRDGLEIPGATGRVLELANVQPEGPQNVFLYSVVVGNVSGSTLASLPATLTISGALEPPFIIVEPFSQTVAAGENLTLTVTAIGQALSYQWTRNDVNIDNATAATLLLEDVTSADSGVYRVTVSNSSGSDLSEPATVRVLVPVPFANVRIQGGQIMASIQTVAGLTYRIQVTDALLPNDTTVWTTIATIPGDGSVVPLAADIEPAGNRFFRIIVE